MSLVSVICPHCSADTSVESAQEAAICAQCGKAFVVEKAMLAAWMLGANARVGEIDMKQLCAEILAQREELERQEKEHTRAARLQRVQSFLGLRMEPEASETIQEQEEEDEEAKEGADAKSDSINRTRRIIGISLICCIALGFFALLIFPRTQNNLAFLGNIISNEFVILFYGLMAVLSLVAGLISRIFGLRHIGVMTTMISALFGLFFILFGELPCTGFRDLVGCIVFLILAASAGSLGLIVEKGGRE